MLRSCSAQRLPVSLYLHWPTDSPKNALWQPQLLLPKAAKVAADKTRQDATCRIRIQPWCMLGWPQGVRVRILRRPSQLPVVSSCWPLLSFPEGFETLLCYVGELASIATACSVVLGK